VINHCRPKLHQAGAAILGPILVSAELEAETATWTTWRSSSGRGNVGTPMEIETSMPRGPGKILDKQEINGGWCQGGAGLRLMKPPYCVTKAP
jgi:hypothetical protein